jgi:hypothetical protein
LIVSRHLGVPPFECHVDDVREWIAGSFIVCVPVSILKAGSGCSSGFPCRTK